MDRRAFLTGLIGVASAVALGGIAEAAPLSRTMGLANDAEPNEGLRAPDGTEVENAQVSVRIGRPRRYSGYYRRRRRFIYRSRRRYYRRARRIYRPRLRRRYY